MTKLIIGLGLLVVLLPLKAHAAEYYVAPAPSGNDAHSGTEAEPFATIERAQDAVSPGDTVYFREGTYYINTATEYSVIAAGVILNKSGEDTKRINYWAYPDETPVFDFSGITNPVQNAGFLVTGSYLHFKRLQLTGAPQTITTRHESWAIYHTGGNNNIYELLDLHHNQGPGLFIAKGGDNLILNCDSHHNWDPKSSSGDGTNADGFGIHTGIGETGNVIRGCRAWYNTDDGYDLIQAKEPVIIEDSWAWYNGYQPDTTTRKGDGNGFKGGGFDLPPTNVPPVPPQHTIRRCVAFLNTAAGFNTNFHPVANYWYNNTAYSNGANYYMRGLDADVGIMRNNLAYEGTALMNGEGIDDVSNSWSLPVTISDDDFMSVAIDGMDGPRQPDGSLPVVDFMRLQQNSDLIDKGQDVGLDFVGTAPDLGAFEFGASSTSGSGGSGGSGSGGSGSGGSGSGGSGSGGSGGSADSGVAVSGTGGAATAGIGGVALADGGNPDGGGQAGTGGGTAASGAGGPATVGGGAGTSGASPNIGGNSGSPSPQTGSGGSGVVYQPEALPTRDDSANNGGCSCQIHAGLDRPGLFWPLLLLAIGFCLGKRRFGRHLVLVA